MKKIVLSLLAATTALTLSAAASAAPTIYTNNWSFIDQVSNTVVKGTLSGLSGGNNISTSSLFATVTQAPSTGFGVFNLKGVGEYSASNGIVTYASFYLYDAGNNYLVFGTNPDTSTINPQLRNISTGSNAYNFDVGTSFSAATAAVPEPAAWAMMILGMGAVGFAMRRRSKVTTRVSYAV
jgi:hypothetical protein